MDTYAGGSLLLDGLPAAERSLIAPVLTMVRIPERSVLDHAGDRVRWVDFPVEAVYSLVAVMIDGSTCEVGTIGRDGFSPVEVRLGAMRVPRTTFAQVGGLVARMEVDVFAQVVERSPVFAAQSLRYVTARLFAAEQYTACNLMHLVVQRLARWLLVTRDRLGRNEFTLTHDFLAVMLGVRRPGVTKAAQELQASGAIDYRRGVIVVRDPERLRAASCECYDMTRAADEGTILVANSDVA